MVFEQVVEGESCVSYFFPIQVCDPLGFFSEVESAFEVELDLVGLDLRW